MTDENKDDAPMTEQECSENADDVINCMKKALEAAVGASKKPAWAIAGLMLAVDSLKAAMVEKGLVSGVDLREVIRWTEGCIADDPGSGAAVALQEIGRRQRIASATPEELQAVIHAATACVERAREFSSSIVGSLLVLGTARHMLFAMLKHKYPEQGDYDDAVDELRAMENTIQPDKIQVTSSVGQVTMSKGGDA